MKSRLVLVFAVQGKQLLVSRPPSVAETLDAARSQFDPDDIDYSTDDGSASDDSDSKDSSSGGESSDDDRSDDGGSAQKRQKKKEKKSKHDRSRDGRSHGSCSKATSKHARHRRLNTGDKREIRELVETVVKGTKEMVELMDSLKQLAVQTGVSLRPLFRENSPANVPQLYGQARACFMCGKTEGADLGHRISIQDCPETRDLIASDVIQFSPLGILVRADGSPLPRSLGPGTGEIAAILQRESKGNQLTEGEERDVPPHHGFVRTAMDVGLCADGRSVLGGSTMAVSVEPVYAFPTIRTQVKAGKDDIETQVRFEEEHEALTWEKTYRALNVHKPADPVREFTKNPGTSQVSLALHPSNMEEGWWEKQRTRTRMKEITEDEGGHRTKPKSTHCRFTSTVQEQIPTDDIHEQLPTIKVALSPREILGMSPEFRRTIQTPVKTRSEFVMKAGDWTTDTLDGAETSDVQSLTSDEPGIDMTCLKPAESYCFTLTVPDRVSAAALDNKVFFSIREILGMSPELQRPMQALVKTRHDFGTKTAGWANDTSGLIAGKSVQLQPRSSSAAIIFHSRAICYSLPRLVVATRAAAVS